MNCWIFKCRPDWYRLDDRLADPEPRTTWTINPSHYRNKVKKGDLAFIWQTGPQRGIRAAVRIDSAPRDMPELETELKYARHHYNSKECRVVATIVRRDLNLPAPDLRAIPGLKGLSVFHGFRQSTVFPVTSHQAAHLFELTSVVRHFIVYHNPKVRHFSILAGSPKSIVTTKPIEALVGQRVWLMTGEGSPRRYYLVATFVVDQVQRSTGDSFPNRASGSIGTCFNPPVPIDEEAWFGELNRITGNFAFGLTEATDATLVRGREHLREAAESGIDERLVTAIRQSTKLSATTKSALIKARIGQGPFREALMKIEKGCRLTAITNPTHLVASHCKPWRDSSDSERLDGNNGLLLSPNIDHLFDSGLISFSDAGDLLISRWADKASLRKLGVETKKRVNVGAFSAEQRKYIAHHRRFIFERNYKIVSTESGGGT